MKFTWIGGPTFLLEIGNFKVLTDPVLNDNKEAFIMNGHPSTGKNGVTILRNAPVPDFDLSSIDYVLVSHMHSDHFDKVAKDKINKNTSIIMPNSQKHLLQDKFENIIPTDWWKSIKLTSKNQSLNITSVPARHAHKDDINMEMGTVNGYLIEYSSSEEKIKIYWTGDTVWFEDMKKIKDHLGEIDILIPHMGAVGIDGPYDMLTLNSEEAIKVYSLFNSKYIIPIHHSTFSHYVEPISVFDEEFKKADNADMLILLKEGESWIK